MLKRDLAELGGDIVAAFVVSGAVLFKIAAEIDEGVEFFDFLADLVDDFDSPLLDDRGSANRLLHPQLTALHATCKINFTFAREQGNGAHFAQVDANRVIGIDRFFGLVLGGEFLAIVDLFRVEEVGFLIERKPERLVAIA
ncbi:MAG TPA: hypothetical protein VKS01_12280 [Bryobacteraceae bacterium]|nr:hypothetical protein [Bryobacteraceae bacterium]